MEYTSIVNNFRTIYVIISSYQLSIFLFAWGYMKFVTDHITKHHFFHAPHRWFFALLLSPIHLAEMHYQRRYRLTYGHAKALFCFDMCLLVSIFLLLAGIIFWKNYDPTVIDEIELTLKPLVHDPAQTSDRLRSGEHVEYQIGYKNKSGSVLLNPAIILQFPNTFILESATPAEKFEAALHRFALPAVPPGGNGQVKISGFFWGKPDAEEHVSARLSYRQENRDIREEKISTIITTLRGAVIETTVSAPEKVITGSAATATITLKNSSHHPVENIRIKFPAEAGIDLDEIITMTGASVSGLWNIPKLEAGQTATATAKAVFHGDGKELQTFTFQPEVAVDGQYITQKPVSLTVAFVYPKIEISNYWKDDSPIIPGESRDLQITLKNTGAVDMEKLAIKLTAPSFIIPKEIPLQDSRTHANLLSLTKGTETTITIAVPTRSILSTTHTDVMLAPLVTVSGDARATAVGGGWQTSATAPSLRVATTLSAVGAIRYFTDEGDQLGRGPLPPQIGKETKYWATLYVKNTTSDVTDLTTNIKLAPAFSLTGKNSLSSGNIKYDAATGKVSWQTPVLGANQTGAAYFEISFTPTEADRGTTPVAIKSVNITGTDVFTGSQVSAAYGAIDLSLREDQIGRNKGVVIK